MRDSCRSFFFFFFLLLFFFLFPAACARIITLPVGKLCCAQSSGDKSEVSCVTVFSRMYMYVCPPVGAVFMRKNHSPFHTVEKSIVTTGIYLKRGKH